MATEAKISTNKDDHPTHPWTATLETEELGTFYGYGKTKQEAIKDVESELNFWKSFGKDN